MAFNDVSFFVRPRHKKCRFCGKWFTTMFPARKTCKSKECREKSLALIKEQNRAANKRYQARKRAAYIKSLTNKKGK